MNNKPTTLFSATFHFFRWAKLVLAKFRSIDAIDTWLAVFSSIGRRLFALVALFLPLKVILLVGSSGVPRYFRGFIEPDERNQWIIALAIGSVVLYLASLVLGMVERNRAMRGSVKVLKSASEIAMFRNQEKIVENYYSTFCGLQADLILSLVLIAAATAMFPALGIFLMALVLGEWLLAGMVLGRLEKLEWRGLAYQLRYKSESMLGVLSAVNFLLVFGFLLVVFLEFGGVNILIAILSILLARQLFSSIGSIASGAVNLVREDRKVNALVFKEHSYAGSEQRERGPFTRTFAVELRRKRLATQFGVELEEIESLVSDQGPADILVLDILKQKQGEAAQQFCELVFLPNKAHLSVNENVLFQYQKPVGLNFARLLGQYEVDGFTGRIYACDRSEQVPARQWAQQYQQLILSHWAVPPSSRLLEAFIASRQLLHDRLTPAFLSRMEVALESDGDRERYDDLQAVLPDLRQAIGEMPLFVFNPKMSPAMTGKSPEGELCVLNWTAWTLAPVGAGVNGTGSHKQALIGEFLSRGRRKGATFEAMLLAARAWDLEDYLQKQRVVSARELLPNLLEAWQAFVQAGVGRNDGKTQAALQEK